MRSMKPELYTVGWVAALADELTAALEVLDETHGRPTGWAQPVKDTNSYQFGSINKHNIVLACLPMGGYGTNNAAVVATTMLSTFPHIRFGLLVGIGAGLPVLPERDIRLGDVVISKPGADSGGVVQYDLGKAQGDGTFKHIGVLDKPPTVLLTALNGLKTKQTRRKTRIASVLAGLDEAIRVEENYQYQGAENDRLFKAAHPHPNGPKNCSDCPKEWEEVRSNPVKPDRTRGPRMFFGTIASGNTVVKDAKRRAEILKLAGEETMCIEMEAAGLMDNFPCLVIRGICDYADSHKNDKWQNYAALTAAATAKELLLDMDAGEVESTKEASDAVAEKKNPTPRAHGPQEGPPPAAKTPAPGGQANADELERLRNRVKAVEDRIRNEEDTRARVDRERDQEMRDLEAQIARLSKDNDTSAFYGQRLDKAEAQLTKLKRRVKDLEESEEDYGSECCDDY